MTPTERAHVWQQHITDWQVSGVSGSAYSTGTCFDTSGDGVLCNVTINSANASLDIGVDLNGTIKIFDANGNTSESGTLTLISVKLSSVN